MKNIKFKDVADNAIFLDVGNTGELAEKSLRDFYLYTPLADLANNVAKLKEMTGDIYTLAGVE